MSESLKITILLPCLNEEQTLRGCIEEAREAMAVAGVGGEVLVVDNGSTDQSVPIAGAAGARVVHESRKGYGSALMTGIRAARGEFVLMGDADGSYDFTALPAFLAKLEEGCELVMGCRLPKGGGRIMPGAMPWKHRWLGNPVLSFLGRLFFKAPVDDFHCGLRAFRREAVLALNLQTPGMEFASEMVVKACLARLSIGQVPVILRQDKRNRPPHLRSWRDGWRHLRFMLLYAPNWLFVYPGLLLTLLGLAGFVALWPGPLRLGAATLDLNTLLACSAALLVGLQVLVLGGVAKTYAMGMGLLPAGKYLTTLRRGRPAEVGTALGILLVLAGLAVFAGAFWQWRAAGFGPLPVQGSLRFSILALTLLGMGVQAVTAGFILSLVAGSGEE